MATRLQKKLVTVSLAIMLTSTAWSEEVLNDVVVIEGGSSAIATDWVDNDIALVGHTFGESVCTNGNCTGCNTCKQTCCEAPCRPVKCNPPWWAHRTGVFGEYLYLRPGDADVVYAIEQNDATNNSFPTGPVGSTAIDFQSGFRGGFVLANTCTTSLVATYTSWEGNATDRLTRNGTNILHSEILHPSTQTTGANSLQESASQSMSFDMIDGVYRHKLFCTKSTIFNWSGGFRYGQLEQQFQNQQEVSVATGLVNVGTDIDFNGFGLLMGLDAERRSCKTGMLCFTRGMASFLGGEWTGSYRQNNTQVGGGIVANDFEEFRISPVLETELGIGWQNCSGCVRATVGYMASWWTNAMSTSGYIDGVRAGQFTDLSDTIGFIGVTSRLEVRF